MEFRGITKITVDAKARFAVPKHHRDHFAGHGITEIVLTADLSGCLLVYPKPVWLEIEAQINALPNSHPDTRRMQRLYVGHATLMDLDASGRVLLSPELREYAEIERRVVLIGQGRKLELWAEHAWAAENERWKRQARQGSALPPPDALQDITL